MPALRQYWNQDYAAGGGPVTRRLSQRLGAVIAWLAERGGLSPSQVTLLGAACFAAAAAALAFIPASAPGTLACFLLLQLGYGLDCADGQLARATGRSSAFGAWLDIATDFSRNLMLAFAVLIFTANTSGVTLAAGAGLLYAGGTAIKLYTLTVIRAVPAVRPAATSWRRRMALFLLDTPVILAAIAVTRHWPWIQLACLAVLGLGYAVVAILQARGRLR